MTKLKMSGEAETYIHPFGTRARGIGALALLFLAAGCAAGNGTGEPQESTQGSSSADEASSGAQMQSEGYPAQASAIGTYQSQAHSFRLVPVVEGLENPWGVAFLPDGEMLVTERAGRLRLVRNATLSDPISGVPEVFARQQGGLLDVAIHPDFEQNRLVYLAFAKPVSGGANTAVIRGRLEGNALTDVEEVFNGNNVAEGGIQFGARMVFDDEYLFIAIGDRNVRPVLGEGESHPAQDLSNHNGTIIRLFDDGRIPTDNPFSGQQGAEPEIWSYGHRSPQGLALHPETGELWESEHGPQGGDELNLIRRGANYGWPVIGYGVQYGGTQIHETTAREGMEQPVHYWVPSIATSGLAFYDGDRFPEWRGDAFIGGLAGRHLARVVLDGTRSVSSEKLLEEWGKRIRDVRSGPDGYLYILTDEADGGIYRLEPA